MRPLTVAMAVLLAALLYVANFSWWMEENIIDQESFTESAIGALALESSRDAMGELIAQRLIDEFPLLVVLEANLIGLFSELLGIPELEEVLALVAAEAHEHMMNGTQGAVVIDLAAYQDLILAPVEAVSPRLAEVIPESWFTSVEVLDAGVLPDLSRYDRWMGLIMILSVVSSMALVVVIGGFVQRRGLAFMIIGASFLMSGLGTAVLVPGGLTIALTRAHTFALESLVTNTYVQFTSYLKVSAIALTLIGVVLVAVGVALWTTESSDSKASLSA